MNHTPPVSIDINDAAENVSPESRNAWEIWKKLTDFSEWLWDAYEQDFLTLAASEPPACRSRLTVEASAEAVGAGRPPKGYHQDDPPF
jgi:hypothetical protein